MAFNRKSKSRLRIPASTTGEYLLDVDFGSVATIVVDNQGGSTFDIISYNFTDEEDTADSLTKIKAVHESGKTSTNLVRSISAPVLQLGIQVTTATGTPVNVEVTFASR